MADVLCRFSVLQASIVDSTQPWKSGAKLVCSTLKKKEKEKENCLGTFPGSWHGYQANSPECKSSCWNHPSVHFLSPLLLQPESRGMLQSIPAVLGWGRGYTPGQVVSSSRGIAERQTTAGTHGPFQVASGWRAGRFWRGAAETEAEHANRTQNGSGI